MSLKFLSLALATTAVAVPSPFESLSKATSDDPCVACQPSGATGTTPPAVGSALSSLYTDVLGSVKGISFSKRSLVERASGFCCRQSLNCVNVQGLNIPMCYDKFTTNFAFADGSYGSLTTGEYTSGSASANLLTGDYTNGSDKGNIYASDAAAKPNTATLSIPPQFTGTGVGGAIPVTELGSVIVYTTTVPGTTVTGPTTIAGSVRVDTVSGVVVSTSVPATTITQATTIAAQTSVVTRTASVQSSAASSASAAASSKGAAGQVTVDSTQSIGMSIMAALMYALL